MRIESIKSWGKVLVSGEKKVYIVNYYIADTHFGHANIIKMSNRPFDTAEEFIYLQENGGKNIITLHNIKEEQ